MRVLRILLLLLLLLVILRMRSVIVECERRHVDAAPAATAAASAGLVLTRA